MPSEGISEALSLAWCVAACHSRLKESTNRSGSLHRNHTWVNQAWVKSANIGQLTGLLREVFFLNKKQRVFVATTGRLAVSVHLANGGVDARQYNLEVSLCPNA